MYAIEYAAEAFDDLESLRKFEQKQIMDAIDAQLKYEPHLQTRNRKRLRPNNVAKWELRVGKFRVFFDVLATTKIVQVQAIGYKEGNKLFIHGEEYKL